MIETKLYRSQSWYRPLSVMVDEKEYELGNIIVYDESGILLETKYGYFDSDLELTIKGNVIKKIKENFTKKENYIKLYKKDFSDKSVYSIYIYKDNVDFKFDKIVKEYNYLYNQYLINGIKVKIFKEALDKKLNILNDKAEAEIKKLENAFGYNKVGLEDKEFNNIISNLRSLNKQIYAENQYIKNYIP